MSHINADAFAGLVEWSGQSFFTAFSDARQSGNYEVYAARFRADGLKIENSEIRVTDAPDFSLNPAVIWTGDEYVVAWDDRRGRFEGGFPADLCAPLHRDRRAHRRRGADLAAGRTGRVPGARRRTNGRSASPT